MGAVASLIEVNYTSVYWHDKTSSPRQHFPKGGLLEFEIPCGENDSVKFKHLHYEVKTSDGKSVRIRDGIKGRKLKNGGNFSYGGRNDGGGPQYIGDYNAIYYDSLWIEEPVKAPFKVYITDNTYSFGKKKFCYHIIPDVKK